MQANETHSDRKRPRTSISAEERESKIREMQSLAEERERLKSSFSSRDSSANVSEKQSYIKDCDPAFLSSMKSDVYLSGSIDMEERVKRNRQNHQRGAESESFLRK